MKFKSYAFVAALCSTLIASRFTLAGDQDFTLVNKTGVSITKIFVSPHDDKKWGEDIMGHDTLSSDTSVEIKFHRDEEAEHWDLKIVDKDGNEIVWADLKLTAISKLTIHYTDNKPTADVE